MGSILQSAVNETISGQELKTIPSYISLSYAVFLFKNFCFHLFLKLWGYFHGSNPKGAKRHAGKSFSALSIPPRSAHLRQALLPVPSIRPLILCFIFYYLLSKFGLGFFPTISSLCLQTQKCLLFTCHQKSQSKSFFCKALLCKACYCLDCILSHSILFRKN